MRAHHILAASLSALAALTSSCSIIVDPRGRNVYDLNDAGLSADGSIVTDGNAAPDGTVATDGPPPCDPSMAEVCDAFDNDCDGTTDGPAATLACGAAENVATALCSAGRCLATECVADHLDCNMRFDDGCEVDSTRDAEHCGRCDASCEPGEGCVSSACSTVLWSTVIGSPAFDRVEEVASDAEGNVFVVGAFSGVADFGTGPTAPPAMHDGFLVSFSPESGAPRFARVFGSDGIDALYAVAVGAEGSLAIGGSAGGAIDLGSGPLARGAGEDGFVAALDDVGNHRWSVGFAGTGYDIVNDVGIDSAGNLYVAGRFADAIDIGGTTMTSRGSLDAFVASYTSTGTFRWARQIGGSGSDGVAMAVANDGTVYVGGHFSGTVDLGGGPLTAIGGSDLLLGSYDGLGALRWARRYGSAGDDGGWSIDVAAPDRVLVGGWFTSTVSVGEGGRALSARAMQDVFVTMLDASGNALWSVSVPGAGVERSVWVDGREDGGAVIAATFDSEIEVDGMLVRTAGNDDSVVAALAPDGAFRWVHAYGSPEQDAVRDVARIGAETGVVVGVLGGALEIGSGRSLEPIGGIDGFVIAFPW